jgi:hypothetical protein
MTEEEKELQVLIRGITAYPLSRVNQDLSDWLSAYLPVRATGLQRAVVEQLNEPLRRLQVHLNQWHSKRAAIFETDTRRSLVYLGDDQAHGNRFPQDLEPLVAEVLATVAGTYH